MVNKDKLIEKLKNAPQNVRYSEIETLFKNDNYMIREGKGSHKIIVNIKNGISFTVAIHNNDCTTTYKKKLTKFYFNNLK